MVQVDQKKGYLAKEVKPNVYLLTDGKYQSAFVVTNEGVIVIDAPESLGANIVKAVQLGSDATIDKLNELLSN